MLLAFGNFSFGALTVVVVEVAAYIAYRLLKSKGIL